MPLSLYQFSWRKKSFASSTIFSLTLLGITIVLRGRLGLDRVLLQAPYWSAANTTVRLLSRSINFFCASWTRFCSNSRDWPNVLIWILSSIAFELATAAAGDDVPGRSLVSHTNRFWYVKKCMPGEGKKYTGGILASSPSPGNLCPARRMLVDTENRDVLWL